MGKLKHKEIAKSVSELWGGSCTTFTEVNMGSAWRNCRRLDVIGLEHTWSPTCIKVAEVKTSKQDFKGDRKWPHYLAAANEFYWACPCGMISRSEIDPRAGLIVVNEKTKQATCLKKPVYTEADPELAFVTLYYLLTWRNAGRTRAETVEQIKKEMRENKAVGKAYAGFVSEKLNRADRKVEAAERDLKRMERNRDAALREKQQALEKLGPSRELVEIAMDEAPGDVTPSQFRELLSLISRFGRKIFPRAREALEKIEGVLGSSKEDGGDEPAF